MSARDTGGQHFATIGDVSLTVTVLNPFAPGYAALGPAVHEQRSAYVISAPKRKRASLHRRR